MSHASDNPVFCVRKDEGCAASYPGSRFDAMKADREGWFHSREKREAYCPEHVPEWVPAWRAKKAAQKFEVQGTLTKQPAVSGCRDCGFRESEEDRDSDEKMKALRASAFEHARRAGHTVDVTTAQVLVIEPERETADA